MSSTISNYDQSDRPFIGISMGDPAGIGPEICTKILRNPAILMICRPLIFGDIAVLNDSAKRCGLPLDVDQISVADFLAVCRDQGGLSDGFRAGVVDFGNAAGQFKLGCVSGPAGKAAYEYIDLAITAHMENWIQAIVTGPINKLSLRRAGFDFPGHTELFAAKTDTSDYCMLQYSNTISCSFVTTHCGYDEVTKLLSIDRIAQVIELTHDAFVKIESREPKLIVCGLNPHAGEDGLFGDGEEERLIVPAIENAKAKGIDVVGPFPPDTCFIPKRRAEFDCVICMYHDQGHIPLKALAFDQAVNTTLGLPIIRTSVDHGTAFDIVGRNLSDPSSLIEAIKLAVKLAVGRSDTGHIHEPKMLATRRPTDRNTAVDADRSI